MTDPHTRHKSRLAPWRAAQYDFDDANVQRAMRGLFDDNATIHMPYPFGDLIGPEALLETCYRPLHEAMPDLERRDWIVMAGETEHGGHWVGCGGHYVGTFVRPWLDIPPTGHLTHMRFHEFYRFEDERVVECQTLWDIPEVMMQANAWPMAPSLGLEFCIPGPATQDGLVPGPWDRDAATAACEHIVIMLEH
ncbi:MAG: ester cyclase, partial [Pseudomonadota bacterium]